MKTRITELLGIEYPIIQGGMAWVATHELASAVSNAGGLGIIGAGGAPATWVRDQIRACKQETDKPFGVNLMLMNAEADEIAKVIAEEGVKVVTTGAGNPGKYISMWKEAGTVVIPVVASVALAKLMERSGVDAVIAEGTESGGHIGEATTMTLVPQVVDRGRWYRRWPWNGGGLYARSGSSSDGNSFCCCHGVDSASELQGQNSKGKGYRFGGYGPQLRTSGKGFA